MKKLSFLVILFTLVFALSHITYGIIKIRPYAGAGYTFVEIPSSYFNWNQFSARGGVQGLFSITDSISIGVDLAYIHAYTITPSFVTFWADYLNVLAVFEFNYSLFVGQFGAGPYVALADNDGSPFGVMFAAGVDIPVSKTISIPIMLRSDIIFDSKTTIPIGLMVGVTIKIP